MSVSIKSDHDDGYEIFIQEYLDSETILISCDNPIDSRTVTIKVWNAGYPGVIGEGIEFDLAELVDRAISEARDEAQKWNSN